MRILVIGSGGREHALTWKLRQSPHADQIFCAPGNAGTGEIAENVAIPVSDLAALVRFAKENRVDLTVVGPDDPLAAGIVDLFTSEKLRAFGPDKSAARIESSKIFAKELMRTLKIPTAEARTFSNSSEALHYAERKPVSATLAGGLLSKSFCTARNARCMPWSTEKIIFCWNRRATTSGRWMAIKGRTRAGWAHSVPPTIGTPNCNGSSMPKS